MLLGTLDVSLLGILLTGTGVEGKVPGQGIIRAGEVELVRIFTATSSID